MFRLISSLLFILAGLLQSVILFGQDPELCLERIVLNYDSVLFDRNRDYEADRLYTLGNKNNNLLFVFKCNDSEAMLSYYLEGNDAEWTPWFRQSVKEYTNLRPGEYNFYVRTGKRGLITGEFHAGNFIVEPPFYLTTFAYIAYSGILLIVLVLLFRLQVHRHKMKQAKLESVIQERTEELMNEKQKTETLLANLLPKDTADEIMSKGKATKQKYNFVTVLFSDIQGFTRIAEEINPEVLIDELDRFFFHFDSVVEKYNIEKIKTIGDAYMCAGGIPRRNRTNPMEVVLAALEMQEYMTHLKKEQVARGIKFWDIRIGIHTGTVIAGVVGHKKLSYDIWGDTVNTASRMESSGIPGKINISGITYEYVKDFFICEYRGKMPVKYKGDLDMYFVKGIRPELRKEGKAEPNKTFIHKLLALKIQDLEDYFFEWYEENAPDKFVFHTTRFLKNICTQAELLATAEKADPENILALRLAALFIKSGMIDNYKEPVEPSVRKLKEMAPDYGFDEKYISAAELIIRNIYDKNTGDKEVRVLSDAINDYRGHVDYPQVTALRYEEENEFVGPLNKDKWYIEEYEMIREFEFFTETARFLKTYSGTGQAENLDSFNKHIK